MCLFLFSGEGFEVLAILGTYLIENIGELPLRCFFLFGGI